MLFIDPGRFGPPAISMTCRKTGSEYGEDIARINWDVQTNIRGQQYAMTNIEQRYAVTDGTDETNPPPSVYNSCDRRYVQNLLYMRFESWSSWGQKIGGYKRQAFDNQSEAIKRSIDVMFQNHTLWSFGSLPNPPLTLVPQNSDNAV